MSKLFSEAEKIILNKFNEGKEIEFEKETWKIEKKGKPRPNDERGECKTDIFLEISKLNKNRQIKISLKLENYEFLENKINKSRALQILGPDALKIISTASKNIKGKFIKSLESQSLSAQNKFTLGWKIEIFKDTKRKLAAELNLNSSQKIDILSGSNLTEEKKNGRIGNEIIKDSGVPNYILVIPPSEDRITKLSPSKILNSLQPIDKYCNEIKINAGFTALNYRLDEDKWDGNRPLAVSVNWGKHGKKINPTLILGEPFKFNGNELAENLRLILKKNT